MFFQPLFFWFAGFDAVLYSKIKVNDTIFNLLKIEQMKCGNEGFVGRY